MHARRHTDTHTHKHPLEQTHAHTHTYTHARTHTHAHTNKFIKWVGKPAEAGLEEKVLLPFTHTELISAPFKPHTFCMGHW